jgi:hypothetical protein
VADLNQFGSAKPPQSGDGLHCAQCEAMLADALDGTLSAADQAAFDLHMVGCSTCSQMLADAKRGAAWMEMLKSPRPEPPMMLVERILAHTTGQQSGKAPTETTSAIVLGPTDHLRTPNPILGRPALVPGTAASTPAAYSPSNVLPFRIRIANSFNLRSISHTLLQPRLAMTAAMAFFSIALTLNLTGVRLTDLRASDLKPSSILRSCYEAKARVVRYSDNLRVVYELESRVRDLQRSTDNDGSTSTPAPPQNDPSAAQPNQKPSGDQQPDDQKPGTQNQDQKQTRPKPGPGSSRRENPSNLRLVNSARLHGVPPAATQAFVVFSPSISKHMQEGGLV